MAELKSAQKINEVALDSQRYSQIERATDAQINILGTEISRLEKKVTTEIDRSEKLCTFNQTFKERLLTEQTQSFAYMAEAGEYADVEEIMETDFRANEKIYWTLLPKRDQISSQVEHTETISKIYMAHLHQELANLRKQNQFIRTKVQEQIEMLADQEVKMKEAQHATHDLLHPSSTIPLIVGRQKNPLPKMDSRRSVESLSSRQSKELLELGSNWEEKDLQPSKTENHTQA